MALKSEKLKQRVAYGFDIVEHSNMILIKWENRSLILKNITQGETKFYEFYSIIDSIKYYLYLDDL